MKALSIAALASVITLSAFTAAPANADNRGFCGNGQSGFSSGFNTGYGYNGYNGYNPNFNNGNRFGWNNNNNYNNNLAWNNRISSRFFPFGNVDNRQASIATRLQQGIASGRLSTGEANKIQSRFDKIAQLENNLRASGNRLSFSERARLNNDLSRLNSQLSRDLRDRNIW